MSDYTNLSFEQCLNLDCYTFKVLFRDAFIYEMNKSENGREYLQECYYMQQIKPDRKSLRDKFSKEIY